MKLIICIKLSTAFQLTRSRLNRLYWLKLYILWDTCCSEGAECIHNKNFGLHLCDDIHLNQLVDVFVICQPIPLWNRFVLNEMSSDNDSQR